MNKMKMKEYICNSLYSVLVVVVLWVAVSGFIQRFKCPSMTETEVFLHIPKSVVCNWDICD